MVDLHRIKADLEKMQCPFHTLPPRIRIGNGILEVESSCCEQFKKLLLVTLAVVAGGSFNEMVDNLRASGHSN